MGGSSTSLRHLALGLEETMTHFLCGLKHFHGPLPLDPRQRLPGARTGKVSLLLYQARFPMISRSYPAQISPFPAPGVWETSPFLREKMSQISLFFRRAVGDRQSVLFPQDPIEIDMASPVSAAYLEGMVGLQKGD
jgi:hypothetical protein